MIKKLHVLDYLIIILFLFLGATFISRVNNEFLTNADEELYPASISILLYDRAEVLNNIKIDQPLAEDKTVAHGKIATVETVSTTGILAYDLTGLTRENLASPYTQQLQLQKVTLKVDLTKKGLNYYLGNKEIKIGKPFVLETEFLYLNSKIIDFQLGVYHE